MRRICALLLGLAVLAAACGGNGNGTDGGADTGPVTIQFWHSMTAANATTLDTLTQQFNASQDRVKVEPVFQGSYSDVLTKYLASLNGGELPALAQIEDVSTQLMVDSGSITPVQQFIDAEKYDLSDFVPRVLDYYRLDGRLNSMPWNVSNPVLFYNKKAFEAAGLDPNKPPTTLDEIKQYSEQLVKRDSAGNITRSGIALEISPWYVEQMLAKHGDLFVNNGNGRDERATEAVFNSDAGKTIFRWWSEMVHSGLAVNVGDNPNGMEHLLAIAADKAVMTYGTSAALRSVVDILAASDLPNVEVGVAPMPSLEGGDGGVLVGGASLWIVNKRSKAEQRGAWEFIKYLVAPEQQAQWYSGSGYVPIRISAQQLPKAKEVEAKYPEFRVALDQLLNAPSTRATQGAVMGAYPQVRLAVKNAVEDMLLNNRDPDQAADNAAAEATTAMKDYNKRVE